jgi:glycosyltransferase involved in cell wall biosynthesis
MDIGRQSNQEPLRVAYLQRGYADEMTEMLEAMADFNRVYYICVKADESTLKRLSGRVHVFKSGAPRVSRLRNLIYMRKVAAFLRGVNPDIIHIQSGLIWELFLLACFVRKPVVLTRHDVVEHLSDYSYAPIQRLTFAVELRLASAVIVHSDCLVKMCYEAYGAGIGTRPVRSIPLGVNSCYGQSNGGVRPGPPQILFFGRIDKYKGLEVLAQAWPTVRACLPGARLVIAGATLNPKAEHYYQALFAHFPEVDCRLAYQSEAQVSKLFSESSAIVLPYIEASQSGVLMLAHAFALPAVVSPVGGLADVAKDGVNCLTFARGDAGQLAQALVRIASDHKLSATLRANIIVERETVFSWKSIVREIDSLYREALASQARPRTSGDTMLQ